MKVLIDFLALRRSMVGLLAMVILVGAGEKMAERFLPKYLDVLGGGALAIGILGGLRNLLGAVYSYPGGYVSDRVGFKRALVVFNLISIAGYAVVILIPAWPAAIAGAVLFLSWSAISLPASMDLVGKMVPTTKRAMGVSMHSLIRRVPAALGPLAGGALIDRYGVQVGIQIGFSVAIAMALLALCLQQQLIEEEPRQPAPARSQGSPRRGSEPASHHAGLNQADDGPARIALLRSANGFLRGIGRDAARMPPPLHDLLTADILIRFCEQIPDAFVILWCMNVIAGRIEASQFGVLTTVEMATAAACYIPVAYFADRGGKRPFVLATFVFFTLFPLTLLFSHSFWPLVVAFVVRGLKEFGDATRKALILDLAPEDCKARMFGVYYLIRDVTVSLAAFGGAWLWAISPQTNLLTAFGFGAAATVWYALRGRDVTARSGAA